MAGNKNQKGRKAKAGKPQNSAGSPGQEKNLKSIEDQQRENFELELSQIRKQRNSKAVLIVIVFASLVGSFCIVSGVIKLNFKSSPFSWFVLWLIIAFVLGCALVMYTNLFFDQNESTIRQQMLDFETSIVQKQNEIDIFESSLKMSYTHLNQYYLQTREQAQRGFLVCVSVSICGLLLILVGIAFMYLERIAPSYITCATGAITEFIAAIFFYLYNKTVTSMRNYHDKLVLSHNVSIALKVAESLPDEEKVTAKKEIIRELLKDFNMHLVKEEAENETDT